MLGTSSGNSALTFIEVHVPSFATHESLMRFYFTAKEVEAAVFQRIM